MKIEGQKYLFGNYYERMSIVENNEGIVCRVKPSISNKLITGKNISGNFKAELNNSKDDYEKVLKVVEYFLRYSKISMLRENKGDYRVKYRDSIEIDGNRKLLLSINNNSYGPQILELIKNKCLLDLEDTLFDILNKEKVVSICFCETDDISNIDVYDNGYFDQDFEYIKVPEEKCISIDFHNFMKEKIQVIIIKLMNRLLEQSNSHCSYHKSGYMHIKIDNLSISLLFEEIEKEIKDMIDNHNWDLLENNQKQMKLEYRKRR